MAVKQNIVFILPALCSGGAERALITLMNNINRDMFEPHMMALDDTGPLRDWVSEEIDVYGLGGVSVGGAYFKLKTQLQALKPDIVMTTMAHSNFLVMLLKPFFPNVKFVIREAVIPSSILQKHKKKSWILKRLYKALYPRADMVLSPSQDIIDEFRDVIGIDTGNHHLLYNQVDVDSIVQASKSYEPKEGLRFVCAGRLHYQKGYDRLIEALKGFSPTQDWEVLILGDGEEEHALQKLTMQNDLQGHVKFLGNVQQPWGIIASADYLLLPSRWEGMPNVVLESLACGTPVIASADANGVKEIQAECEENNVLIADDMAGFVVLMEQGRDKSKQAKLPDMFTTQNIMKKFEALLLD